MQGGPLSGTLRCSAQAAASTSSAAAAANLLLHEVGTAAQPLALLRALSSASNAIDGLEKVVGPAASDVEACEQQLAVQQRHCRQLSHYAASTSGRACGGSTTPIPGASSSAAAWLRGPSAGLATRWRAFSSSSAASSAAARRSHGSSPERSFASQPAFAYEEPDYDAAAAVEAAASLQRAQQAVQTLKARARARLDEARALAASPSPYGEPSNVSDMRRLQCTEVADLVKVQKAEEIAATEAPVWERLSHYSSGWHRGESMAALHLYRQEVQMGHDADALSQGTRGAAAHSLGHVPFLRSGLLAAHQGFGLQSELGRAALPARLAPAVATNADAPAVSRRTRGALQGLHLAMDLTRSAGLEGEQGEGPEALHVLAEAEAAVAAVMARRRGGAAGRRGGAAGPDAALAAVVEPAAAVATAAAEEVEDELLLEESQQGGLLEALDWQERLRHENPGERLSAARSLRARRQSVSAAMAAGAAPPRGSRLYCCPTPAASEDALLEALAGVEGLRLTSKLRAAVQGLYASPRPRFALSAPLAPPQDPAGCAERAAAMGQLLVEELGGHGCAQVVSAAPWVLLLDPQTHGAPQLAALHLAELDPAQRAQVVCGMPRLLQLDVDSVLLPLLEYLQSLGMSTEDMARVLLQDPLFADPTTLPMLKSSVAFWRGKGMARQGLIELIKARPQIVRTPAPKLDLKLSWLADHTGFGLDDVALCTVGFTRSLTSVIGPRVAYAQHKGFRVANPSEFVGGGRGGCRMYGVPGVISLRNAMTQLPGTFLERVGGEQAEFEAFRERWLQRDFPAWLQRHRPGIEHYRALTQPPCQARQQARQQ